MRPGHFWAGVLVFLGLLMLITECGWRARGHRPNVADNRTLWAMHRENVYSWKGKRALVVIGNSRAQTGLDPTVLAAEFPAYHVVHLAIDGTSSYAIMDDLCHDPLFDGLILFATDAWGLSGSVRGDARDEEYLEHYLGSFQSWASWDERLSTGIASLLQSRLAIFSSTLSLREVLRHRVSPRPAYSLMTLDRFRPTYFRNRMTPQALKALRAWRVAYIVGQAGVALPLSGFRQRVKGDLRESSEVLQRRGGRLFLVQLPTSGEHWRVDSACAPKQQYWDEITAWSGIPTIHFRDYPELSEFDCPDTSHLDGADAPEFTLRLSRIVRSLLSRGPL